jgi:formylglycine-generating enzyme required for sulfatase activity
LAYCEWANRKLPTEAQWESAAQGNYDKAVFTWGDEVNLLNTNANTWQGDFPTNNESIDGFEMIAPVKSFSPNSIGIFDMIGNVWEITDDLFNVNYYSELNSVTDLKNLKGASSCYNPSNPYEIQHVMKGGSFLCHDSYCASYRISARMGVSIDSGSDHTGFRTIVTPEMLLNK